MAARIMVMVASQSDQKQDAGPFGNLLGDLSIDEKEFLKNGIIKFRVPKESREDIVWITNFLYGREKLDDKDPNMYGRIALYMISNQFKQQLEAALKGQTEEMGGNGGDEIRGKRDPLRGVGF